MEAKNFHSSRFSLLFRVWSYCLPRCASSDPYVNAFQDYFLTRHWYWCDSAAGDVVRSGVTGKDGEVLYNDYRTSHGIFITKYMDDPVVVALAGTTVDWSQFWRIFSVRNLTRAFSERIEEWTLLPKEYGEVFYLLRYELGQEYKQHTDWFQGTPESLAFLGPAGNRLATVIVYLSDVEEGGETSFPAVGLKIRPKKGDAIMFWNRTPDFVLDPLALHSSLPVIKGTKWSITRWIRERGMWLCYCCFVYPPNNVSVFETHRNIFLY